MKSITTQQIEQFNNMYRLPIALRPTTKELGVSATQRLKDLKVILLKELGELDAIIDKAEAHETNSYYVEKAGDFPRSVDELEVLTDVADLLVDLQVYAQSEMMKFGLPNDTVMAIVMNSNFSKLGADGQPIYDANGKVQKGPGYWKPEPQIRTLLTALQNGGAYLVQPELGNKEHNGAVHDSAWISAADEARKDGFLGDKEQAADKAA